MREVECAGKSDFVMNNQLLRHLISHTVTELTDMGAGFGKTKLVKLLYLMDVENYRRRQETISGLEWRFYHYGPYAFEIDSVLNELSFDIPQESFTTESGHKAIAFRPERSLKPSLGKHVRSLSELRLVNRVIRDWGETELNVLLDHVYFYTEPMKHARRGELLDFLTVERKRHQSTAKRVPRLPSEHLSKYRARFQVSKTRRVRQPLHPSPRFDNVYREGLAHIASEEHRHATPLGRLEISEEEKEHFRGRGGHEASG